MIIFDFFFVTELNCLKSGKRLRGLSLRSIWFELARPTVTPELGFFLYVKLHWVLEVKEGKEEYDPETNRYDAVSLNE